MSYPLHILKIILIAIVFLFKFQNLKNVCKQIFWKLITTILQNSNPVLLPHLATAAIKIALNVVVALAVFGI